MSVVTVTIKRLPHGHDLPLPRPATAESAGLDLLAAVVEPITLEPGQRARVPAGIALALPRGFEAQVRPRSGLALHHGVTVLNSPGTIDADYRGEVQVILVNLGDAAFRIERGMRIAQMVVAPVSMITWREARELGESQRHDGGFGSTGGIGADVGQ